MWDAFLNRASESYTGVSAKQRYFGRRKLDIVSVEYQSYIHKKVLSYLDNYAMETKKDKPRKGCRSNKKNENVMGTSKNDNNFNPVYLKIDTSTKEDSLKQKTARTNACECLSNRKTRPNKEEKQDSKLCKNVRVKCSVNINQMLKKDKAKQASKDDKIISKEIKDKMHNEEEEKAAKKLSILIFRKRIIPKIGASLLEKSVDEMKKDTKKITLFGDKGSGFKTKGEPQDFYKLRKKHVQSGSLFEDPEFPATDSSIYFSRRPNRNYEWKRPHEICNNPQFFVEGFSRFDIQQGELSDCWLLAAAANLTLYHRLFLQIVPNDQDFDENYAGIFHFRFWQYGKWMDVVIDDRLPTYKGELIFLHSDEENEFWSALLEKAYAKLYGSYEALQGGSTCEAMEDFTGGVTEIYEIEARPPNLFKIMVKAFERASLMGCAIEPDPNVLEAHTPQGLVRGHAYSITRVQYVDMKTPNVTGKIPLLRLRNPWGNEFEWNGAWSDGAPEWNSISESEKEELGLIFDVDGEFWICYEDFVKYFNRLEICNLSPDSWTEEELLEGNKKKWVMSVFEGEWVKGTTAGGCRNFLETFWHNPQYRITLGEVDDDDEEGNCTLIVALMQKNRRQIRNTGENLTIGFTIYHLPYPDKVPRPLDLQFFKYNASVAKSPSFVNLREVTCRFKLPSGTYCIVPTTFDPNEEGEFLLRVFSEHQNVMEEHDKQIGYARLGEEVAKAEPSPEEKEENELREAFVKLAGEDGEIDWRELQCIFNELPEFAKTGFSKDISRSMIAMLDEDRSGKLCYPEFKKLCDSLRNWKNAWMLFDKDKSGTFSRFEFREAIEAAGYYVNNKLLNALMHRYGKDGELDFDDFIMCAIKLKTMIDIFNEKDKSKSDTATFSLQEWLEYTLYT